MSAIAKLFGDSLLLKEENTNVQDFNKPGSVVGIYFSAHWCPPCRGFTPKLVEWYNKFKKSDKASKMDMVFVSSDRDEASFKEYYVDMPWHALPYADRERKAKLSKKFKVNGIPSLVFVEGDTGKLITKDGRGHIIKDPEAKDFPWYPKTLEQMIQGTLMKGEEEMDSTTLGDTVKAIYFSASWCGPCRNFTPVLKELYNKMKESGKNFEIIFASWDRDDDSFDSYYKDMPWLAFPHDDERVHELGSHFEVSGIPKLVILDEKNEVINGNARGAITGDPEGKNFPWGLQPLEELTGTCAGGINDTASLIFFTGSKEELVDQAKALLSEPAAKYKEEQKLSQDSDIELPELGFFYEGPNTGDLAKSLRDFVRAEVQTPQIIIIDVPEQRKYISRLDKFSEADIKDIIEKFKSETLEFEPVKH